MKHLVWMLGLGLVVACVRVVTPPQATDTVTVKKPQGQACGDGEECATGHCQDQVCCDHACAATEACNLERAYGSCAPRVLGDACGADNARCRSGFCVDGVCCESACDSTCFACAEPGQEGQCVLAADNSNPRNSCQAFCTACFGGFCAPALAGTDPGGDCTGQGACAPPLSGAGAPECRAALRDACSHTSECAAGLCLNSTCTLQQEEPVPVTGVPGGALHVRAMDAAVDSRGQPSLVLRSLYEDPVNVGRLSRAFTLMQHREDGWAATLLGSVLDCYFTPDFPLEPFQEDSAAKMIAVGTSQLLFLAQGVGCNGVSGLLQFAAQALWLTPTGQVSRRDILWVPSADPDIIENVQSISAAFDGQTVTVMLGVYRFNQRSNVVEYLVEVQTFNLASGAWKPAGRISTGLAQWGPLVLLRGRPYVLAANADASVGVYRPGADADLAPDNTVNLPSGCTVTYFSVLTAAASEDGTAAVVAVRCSEEESTHGLIRLDVAVDGAPTLGVIGLLSQASDNRVGQAPVVPLGLHAAGVDLAVFNRSEGQLQLFTTQDGSITGGWPLHVPLGRLERLDLLGSATQGTRWMFLGASQVELTSPIGVRGSQVYLQRFTLPPAGP